MTPLFFRFLKCIQHLNGREIALKLVEGIVNPWFLDSDLLEEEVCSRNCSFLQWLSKTN